MVKQPDNISQSELKQLWGEFVPPLTPEQVNLSVKLWQKIQARKRRQPKQDATFQSSVEFDK